MEQEKRLRREIANSNERRRMQSINAGFQSLRTLLPHHEGEKLSKAAILQQTAEYIYQLEQEKTRLLSQNCQLKRQVNQQMQAHDHEPDPSTKRRKHEHVGTSVVVCVSEATDEGIGSMSPEPVDDQGPEGLRREMIELRMQLDRERRVRLLVEDQVRTLEAQLQPERIREITQHVQRHYSKHSPGHEAQLRASPPPQQQPQLSQQQSIVIPVSSTTPPPPIIQQQQTTLPLQYVEASCSPTHIAVVTEIPVATTETVVQTIKPDHLVQALKGDQLVQALKSDQLVQALKSDQLVQIARVASPIPSPLTETTLASLLPAERLPSVLEAAIKAEPKVEVEPAPRVPSPASHTTAATAAANEDSPQNRIFLPSTSRQNLETIVEAIRHLEGDHMFSDDPPGDSQDVPLELTTNQQQPLDLGFRAVRPGVIVVKHT